MLELLASGQVSDFIELSGTNEFVQHLNSYGLISWNKGIPKISLPVAGRYIAVELAKKEGRKTTYKLIKDSERQEWIRIRIRIIIEALRDFENNVRFYKMPELYGINSFPEAEKLLLIPVASDHQSFATFINTLYRCFVESINNFGKSRSITNYLDAVIQKDYPILYRTLDKIKEYRNGQDHLLLTDYHQKKFSEYIQEDLENFSDIKEKYFCIQQKLIIELITSIHAESIGLE